MAIPHKLRLFSCFVNGDNYLGKVTSFTRPKLSRKMRTIRAVACWVRSVLISALRLARWIPPLFGGVIKALFLEYGAEIDGTRLRFAGEYFTDGESQLVEVELRGRFTELDGGDSKQGKTRRKATPLNPPTTILH
jgi:P2 family phage contractile tail tube protein